MTTPVRMFSRCMRCHRQALNGFIGLAGVSLRPAPRRVQHLLRRTLPRQYHSEAQRTTPSGLDEQRQSVLDFESELEVPTAESQGSLDTANTTQESTEGIGEDEGLMEQQDTASDVPWYLQDDEVIVPEISLAERQRLPDIPGNAPEQLKEILERLSIDIGLDYLHLLDLRSLDPPPALGAGVIMVIGTARSEKHLHVSADRFARWLRSAYKLSPQADGLLGRNELKLRLKRRAKRAKLLGSVGAKPRTDEDDGTRVGWICVDAGYLEHGSIQEKSLDDSGIVGFGSPTDGTKLVVQIMTEDKRREVDLEALWERAFERQRRRLAKLEETTEAEVEEVDQETR